MYVCKYVRLAGVCSLNELLKAFLKLQATFTLLPTHAMFHSMPLGLSGFLVQSPADWRSQW